MPGRFNPETSQHKLTLTTMNTNKTKQQPNNLDNYGYTFQPDSSSQLRNTAIRTTKTILLACIYLLMIITGSLLRLTRLGKHYSPLTPQTFHPQHILVIRLDLIGDLVLSLTVVQALKHTYPHAEIDLLATPSSASVVLDDPQLTQIITYDPNIWRRPKALFQPKNWRDLQTLLYKLHARHYDLAISVYGPWAAILSVISRAKRRVGFGRESYPGFMTDSVPGRHWHPGDNKHEVDYCLELARAAGATPTPEDRIPHLEIDPQSAQEIEQLLHTEGVQDNKPLIACHVSSNNGQSKRWPLTHWATLLDRLICKEDAHIVLTGAPADLPIVENVISRMHEHPINLAGKTSLTQLAALLKRANLLISGDSGPIHMAAALGTPIIGFYGPTNPALTGPVSPDATVLRSPIWCSPCYNTIDPADCRFYTTQCMKNILPSQVFAAVQDKLTSEADAPPHSRKLKDRPFNDTLDS
jgi:lipopolysaccharide heptosyltransferase II